MKQNMGTADRIIRAIVVAPVLLVIAYLVGFASVVGIIATVLAVVMLGTAAVGFCPLYVPFHLHTDHRHAVDA
ncbi:MAG: YgaP family membrane protein [Acidimicrobiales bacterium]